MRVLLDARMISMSGIGRYIEGLLQNTPEGLSYEAFGSSWDTATTIASRNKIFSLGEQWEIPSVQRKIKAGLWHSPHFNAPLLGRLPLVVTIHDLAFDYFPEEFSNRRAKLYYKALLPLVLKRARSVIVVSHNTAKDLQAIYQTPSKKIHVTHPGINRKIFNAEADDAGWLRVKTEHSLPENYILYVGLRRPRKNLLTLLQAISGVPEEVCLVIAGPKDNRFVNISEEALSLGIKNRVIETGYLGDQDLLPIYQRARLVVCPSLYEGFGFPLLEAMAAGAPVVASDIAPFRETGGDAALFFDPRNPQELAEQAKRILKNGQTGRQLRAKGLERTKSFPWSDTLQKTIKAYESAL